MAGQLIYPNSGAIYLQAEVNRLNGIVSDMIDTLVMRDQRIAQLEAELTAAKMPSNVVELEKKA